MSNQSLVLQKVTREQAGSYTCEASNVEGDQVSNPVQVSIMCKFFLKQKQLLCTLTSYINLLLKKPVLFFFKEMVKKVLLLNMSPKIL